MNCWSRSRDQTTTSSLTKKIIISWKHGKLGNKCEKSEQKHISKPYKPQYMMRLGKQIIKVRKGKLIICSKKHFLWFEFMSHEFKISFRDQLLCNCCIIYNNQLFDYNNQSFDYNNQSFDYAVNLLVKVFESLFLLCI